MSEGAGRQGIALSDRQRIAWLRLIRSDNVGPVTFRDLINHFGTAEAALEMLPELSRRGGAVRAIRIASRADAERELDIAERHGAAFVGIGEPDYPPLLRKIDGAPPLLAIKGNTRIATAPAVGIVGSRNASVAGAKFAGMLARDLGAAGYAIVSGLARGIDTAAHRASLPTGTVAALAGGLDQPYPPENIGLLDDIPVAQVAGRAADRDPVGCALGMRADERIDGVVAPEPVTIMRAGALGVEQREQGVGHLCQFLHSGLPG